MFLNQFLIPAAALIQSRTLHCYLLMIQSSKTDNTVNFPWYSISLQINGLPRFPLIQKHFQIHLSGRSAANYILTIKIRTKDGRKIAVGGDAAKDERGHIIALWTRNLFNLMRSDCLSPKWLGIPLWLQRRSVHSLLTRFLTFPEMLAPSGANLQRNLPPNQEQIVIWGWSAFNMKWISISSSVGANLTLQA